MLVGLAEKSPNQHREFVRSEYYDALDSAFVPGSGDGTFATMYRDQRYKLCIYHGHQLGELYDLAEDPWEFNNLWDDPEYSGLKSDLMHASFDAAMLASVDVGSQRIGPY